jgi:hypothetical protein
LEGTDLIEPKTKITGNKIIHYGHWHGPRSNHLDNLDGQQKAGHNRPYSSFSTGSRKHLKESLNRWIDSVTYATELMKIKSILPIRRHTFITLTLASDQLHCDKTIKRELLNQFLIKAKRNYRVNNFVWKSELQKNGNIHFHLFSEGHTPHEQLRLDWNEVQQKLGYVERANNYHEGYNPNSTDIHELKKIRNVSAYVGKYMSKESTLRPICGHTWGRSDGIDKLKPYTFHEDLELMEWYQMQSNSVANRVHQDQRFAVTTFFQKMNMRTLPQHVKRELIQITNENLIHLNLIS